eukprot:COSAG04_NODE_2789_length_3573_cov_3.378526_2_plen_47_part_00
MSAFAVFLPSSDHLGVRSLTSNKIGDAGATAVAQALPSLPKLETLE